MTIADTFYTVFEKTNSDCEFCDIKFLAYTLGKGIYTYGCERCGIRYSIAPTGYSGTYQVSAPYFVQGQPDESCIVS